MLGWALRFFIAAMAAGFIAFGDGGGTLGMVLKIVMAVLLALCSVSLVAAYGRSE
jgi:uncharacterized membrane protein YtjA (UPF0391 family)